MLSVLGGSRNLAGGRVVLAQCDQQYIADTHWTAGSSLLLKQQLYAMQGMPKICLSTWALGMGRRQHLSGYSQGLMSLSQF